MGARIIVVEDTPQSLQLMTYLLEAHGHTVTPASDGETGVAHAAQDPPDLIVMDLQLAGGIDGFEALRQVRAAPATLAVPVIAVTAFAMVGDRDQALNAGFTDYLTKPIDPYTFVRDIDRSLPPGLRGQPPAPPDRPADEAVDNAASPRPDAVRILVIDDQPTNIDLMRSMLEPYGYRLAGALSIDEAVAVATAIHPDLVLSDIHIRRESGVDLWNRFQADPVLAAIPFAFTTATASMLDPLPVTPPVIHRPIEPAELLSRVRALLPAGRSDDVPATVHSAS